MPQLTANLDEHVRESLRGKIIAGELIGGAHLSELKISKEYNVSRTPVREALCALAADGLIDMVPHRGAFVRSLSESEIADQKFVFTHMMGIAARMATDRASIESILNLEMKVSSLNTTDVNSFESALSSSFKQIQEGCGSSTMGEALSMVERRMVQAKPAELTEALMQKLHQDFSMLMGAFKRKKADIAEKTMREIMASYYGITETTPTENTTFSTPSIN